MSVICTTAVIWITLAAASVIQNTSTSRVSDTIVHIPVFPAPVSFLSGSLAYTFAFCKCIYRAADFRQPPFFVSIKINERMTFIPFLLRPLLLRSARAMQARHLSPLKSKKYERRFRPMYQAHTEARV